MSTTRDTWSGRVGFILATVGAAVGIGSIWKFPYEVGANGGSAFVLFYFLGLALVVVPLMFAEFAIGRRGRGSPVSAIRAVAAGRRGARAWPLVGALGILTGFLILSFYSVIGGWTLAHGVQTALDGLAGGDPALVRARHDALLAAPWRLLAYHGAFMLTAMIVVGQGVQRGIELASMILMPVLAALMVGLAAYSMIAGDVTATLRFLFSLDPAHLTARAALEALGLGFFSIGVGLGLMIAYSAYAGPEISLQQVAIVSVVADSVISLLAGFVVFPLVFAQGLDPASGPGLVFVTVPIAFARMPFGVLAAVAFFLLLFIAALASAVSMLELVVGFLSGALRWSRRRASAIAGTACFIAGIATCLSFNLWAEWHPLRGVEGFRSATLFDLLDHVTSNVLLPLGGLGISLFAGWIADERLLGEELGLARAGAVRLRWFLRWLVPAGIVAASVAPMFG